MPRHILYPIDNAHIVWFEKSNQWVQLDAPRKFIFDLYTGGSSRAHATDALSHAFDMDPAQSTLWVDNLYDSLEKLDGEGFPRPDFTIGAQQACRHHLPRSRTHHYQYKGKAFSIRYGSPFLETYIHLPLAHLATETTVPDALRLEIFPFEERFALRINGKRCLTADESPQIKRLFFVELSTYLYDIPEAGWMTRLHASAVEKEGQLLLLSSPSGSGKSTMAALLLKQGYRLFADDFIPVCLEKELLYPFPPALCIKKGALPVMEKEGIQPHLIHQQTGYIQPPAGTPSPLKTQSLVFIYYKADAPTLLEKVSPLEALQLFLQEAWVSDHPAGAEKFIQWFASLKFYRLTYSDNDEGVEKVVSC